MPPFGDHAGSAPGPTSRVVPARGSNARIVPARANAISPFTPGFGWAEAPAARTRASAPRATTVRMLRTVTRLPEEPGVLQRRREVVGKLRRDVDRLARDRVGEGKPRRVKELALEAEVARPAVRGVARDGQGDRSEMDADLGCPPRLERYPQKCVARQQLDDVEVRARLARRVAVQRLTLRVVAVPPDRRVDRPAIGTRAARH